MSNSTTNNLPTYENLFGETDDHTVAPSQSVLSPGAYYMELRKLVSQYISLGKGAIPLDTRRPDLENLAFDKDTTFTPLSKLKIVNELLEKLVPLQNLSTHNYPFNLPYDSIHQQIETYLSKNGTTLFETRKQLTANDPRPKSGFELPAALGLSVVQWTFYSTPLSTVSKQPGKTTTKIVAETYGLSKVADPVKALKKVEVFLLKTGLSLAELESLLYQNLSADELIATKNKSFYINDYAGFNKVVEFGEQGQNLENLTLTNLYRINRFIRLSKALNWSFPQLDLALRTAATLLKKKPAINDASLPILSWIFQQVKEYKTSVEQACALLSPLKAYGTKNGPSFFSQVFENPNIPNYPNWEGESGKNITKWVVPVPNKVTSTSANNIMDQNALANALGLGQDDLIAIGMVLLPDPKKSQTITLSLQNMGLLYRLSLLSKMMDVSVTDMLMIADINGLTNDKLVSTVGVAKAPEKTAMEMMTTLLDFSKWLKTFPINLGHLQFIVTGKSSDPAVHNTIIGEDSIKNFQQNLDAGIAKTLYTSNQFFLDTKPEFQQIFSAAVAYLLLYFNLVLSQAQSEKKPDKDKIKVLKTKVFQLKNAGKQNVANAEILSSGVYSRLKQPNCINLLHAVKSKNAAIGDTLFIRGRKELAPLVNEVIETMKQTVDKEVTTYTITTQNHLLILSEENQVQKITLDKNPIPQNIQPQLLLPGIDADGIVARPGWSVNAQPFSDVVTEQLKIVFTKLLHEKAHSEISDKIGYALERDITRDLIDKIGWLIIKNTEKFYQHQQKIFSSHLASLYNVPVQIAEILQMWGDLNLAKIVTPKAVDANQQLSLLNFVSNPSKDTHKKTLASTLKKLQQAAYLIVDLHLSASEAKYFKIKNTSTNVYPISLQTVKTLEQFKRTVYHFQDSQNNLLNILNDVSGQQEVLAKLSGWPLEQINYFCTTISSSGSPNKTIDSNQIYTMQLFFERTKKTGVTIQTLWQLCLYQGTRSTATPQHIADALWAGLCKDFSLEELAPIENSLAQELRNHLVPLAINQLNLLPISPLKGQTNAKALYEYLLLDVKVSGVVETSVVKEAISAMQLYIYRCLNQLESGVTVDPELKPLWTWMHAYREWEANQEVFLWPENYIQPELRKDKTPQFAQLQDSLKQADLTNPDAVEAVFMEYMNGFEEVATLNIVGGSGRDWNDGGIHTKEICFVGKTKKQPSKYYYRVATFIRSTTSNEYKPVTWGQWDQINIPIHPAANGKVMPVFAFGKWYVFWVEEKQAGSQKGVNGNQKSLYQTSLHYSHLDFNKRWVASQLVEDSLQTPSPAKIMTEESIVYPIFIYSIQVIDIIFNSNRYSLGNSIVKPDLVGGIKYLLPNTSVQPKILTTAADNFKYMASAQDAISNNQAVSFSTWINLSKPADQQIIPGLFVNPSKGLWTKEHPKPFPETQEILVGQWFHITIANDTVYLNGKKVGIISMKHRALYVATNGNGFCSVIGKNWSPITAPNALKSSNTTVVLEFNKTLYVGTENGLFQFNNAGWKRLNDDSNGIGNPPPHNSHIDTVFEYKQILYVSTFDHALYQLDGTTWGLVTADDSPKDQRFRVTTAHQFRKHLYVGTNNHGIYEFDGKTWKWINEPNAPPATSIIRIMNELDGILYVGTRDDGLYQFDGQFWSYLSVKAKIDGKPDLWIGAIAKYKERLYVGSGRFGLFGRSDGTDFKKVTDPDGPSKSAGIYALLEFNDILYVGTNVGVYQFDGRKWDHITDPQAPPIEMKSGTDENPKINTMYLYSESLYVGTEHNGLYQFDGTNWHHLAHTKGINIRQMTKFNPLSISSEFSKSMQEALYFNSELTQDEITNIYDNSKDQVTQDCSIYVAPKSAFRGSQFSLPILMQPNWLLIFGGEAKAEYLLSPYKANLYPYRLNTTAINVLSQLLHQPNGIEQLFSVSTQQTNEISFANLSPRSSYFKAGSKPSDEICFSINSGMANYYWELFFHAPFLIAKELNLHQHFSVAKLWYQYIFDPTTTKINSTLNSKGKDINDRFWRFLGLRSCNNSTLKKELSTPYLKELWEDLNNSSDRYVSQTDPFDPQALADLRPIAYQKTTVTHYVDNLINWGDQLFRENTRESIVEAEMQYIEAYDLLGEQPKNLGKNAGSESSVAQFDFKKVKGYDDLGIHDEIISLATINKTIYFGTKVNWVYSSENNGVTWTKQDTFTGPNINKKPVNADIMCSVNGTLYVGTHEGLFKLTKSGFERIILIEGRTEPDLILDLHYSDGMLYVATSDDIRKMNVKKNDGWSTVIIPQAEDEGWFRVFSKENIVFAVTYNYLYRSADSGTTWKPLDVFRSGEDRSSIFSLNRFANLDLVGTEKHGLFTSDDEGKTWKQALNFGARINEIKVLNDFLYLATNTGVWFTKDMNRWTHCDGPVVTSNTSIVSFQNQLFSGSNTHGLFIAQPDFQIPSNQQFSSYWSTVKQRLHDIRNGLNINGQPDQLPLFQPAINPMELVSAVASGEGISQAISSLNSIVPYYRFSVMVGKAKETTQMTIQLGQSVLSAIEKKDAEKLAVLYQTNQHHISQLSISNKQDQINAAEKNIAALQAGSTAATDRKNHYSTLINGGLSSYEIAQVALQGGSVIVQDVVEGIKAASIIGYGLPNIGGLADGGMHFGDAINQGAEIAQGIGTVMNVQSGLAATIGGFKRREKDWEFQKTTAEDDIKQIAIQKLASKYQLSIAEKELVLLKTEIQQGQKVAEFYKKKFSNEQLYQWYIGQVSALYFQAYSLSHEVAMQAENAWKFEHIGQMSSNDPLQFIQSGYWNSLYEGLLAGEGLLLDVHRMEKAFMDEDVRPLEIEKTFSLKELPNVEFSNLQTKGQCLFSFTQTDFDDDFPDHYCRKIKSISVSIPMVVGPYQTIPATLVQQSSRININTAGKDIYVKNKVTKKGISQDQRIDLRPNQQLALSRGVNDNGMFTLNFDDPRYLPFEGTGAISNWNLLINNKNIDISTLTDVIIQVKYTALPGDSTS